MERSAKTLRKNLTDAERWLWQHLRNRGLSGYKFRRQHPIGPFVVDFACIEKGVVIELVAVNMRKVWNQILGGLNI